MAKRNISQEGLDSIRPIRQGEVKVIQMPKTGIREIRAYLAQKPSDALIDEIILLVRTFPEVNEYYRVKLSSAGDSEALEKYKGIIRNEFFPKRGLGRLRLSNIRKAMSDYKKVSSYPEGRLELMLCFVENGAQFIREFGDIDERFYESMENTYEEACKLVSDHGLKAEWKERFYQLVKDTDDTGYGFGDTIRSTFKQFFGSER